jgi:hypothetical protein
MMRIMVAASIMLGMAVVAHNTVRAAGQPQLTQQQAARAEGTQSPENTKLQIKRERDLKKFQTPDSQHGSQQRKP